jgi:cytochrome c-type biogenesis protein CcmH/NrfG
MLFDMSKPMLESFAAAANMMVRVFAILAAVSAVLYLLSSWRLQKANKRERDQSLQAEDQRAGLEAEISKAQGKLEELKNENLRLAAQLEQEHEARLDILRRFGPRGLSPAAAAGIIAALQPYAGQKVNFGYFTELETAGFAEQLLNTFKESGWKPQVFKLKSIQTLYGIEYGGPNPEDPALHALGDAVKLVDKRAAAQAGMASVLTPAQQPQFTDQLWIMVGLHRPHLRKRPDSEPEPEQ